MTSQRILIVEDDPKIARLINAYLNNAGYNVATLSNGNEAIPQIKKSSPDLVILDIMLPGKDGMEICREARKFSNIPIIMLTAKIEEIDRLLGLELGADDYLCKPFSPREMVARVKAVLRRICLEPIQEKIIAGPISLDPTCHRVMIHDVELQLTPNEFEVLKILMMKPNQVFSRNDLIVKVQGYDFEGYERTIDVHKKNLRKKINEHLPDQKIIKTVYGVGYAFSVPKH
jgi:two-component system, OmpR family, response regulator BaeR